VFNHGCIQGLKVLLAEIRNRIIISFHRHNNFFLGRFGRTSTMRTCQVGRWGNFGYDWTILIGPLRNPTYFFSICNLFM